LGFAVGEEEAHGAGEVGGEFLESRGLGFFRCGAEGAGGQFCLAEENAAEKEVSYQL
jgi:hypothetical protein